MSKYQFYQDAKGEWRWRLKTRNGRIVASARGYNTRAGVRKGIRSHRRAAVTERVVEVKA